MALVKRIAEISGKSLVDLVEELFNKMVAEANAKPGVCVKVDDYLKPEGRFDINGSNSTLNGIYQRLIYTLQNRTGMAGVRKYTEVDYVNKTDRIGDALFGFDSHEVVKHFGTEDEVYVALQGAMPELASRELRPSADPWRTFCKGILSGARFFASLGDKAGVKAAFDRYIAKGEASSDANFAKMQELPTWLAKEIDGIGFTLACDFLKEIGYDFPKPDVHIMDVFKEYAQDDELSETVVWRRLISVAEKNNMSPYRLDKMIWIVCTGKFYLNAGADVKGRKEELLGRVLD